MIKTRTINRMSLKTDSKSLTGAKKPRKRNLSYISNLVVTKSIVITRLKIMQLTTMALKMYLDTVSMSHINQTTRARVARKRRKERRRSKMRKKSRSKGHRTTQIILSSNQRLALHRKPFMRSVNWVTMPHTTRTT